MTEEQKRLQNQGQPASGGQQLVSGQSGVVSGAGPSSSTGGTQSGQFTNLQSYLNANQGQNFGSQVAGKVQSDLEGASRAQQDAAGTFRSDVAQNTVNYDEDLANTAKTDASTVVGDADKRSRFERMRDASYTGPQGLEDTGEAYTRATGATQNAQKAAELTGSESGQRALLQNYYGRPNYSRGQTNLDQFLVQNDATAQPKFQQAQERGKAIGGEFDALKQALSGEGQAAKQATDATRQRVQQEFLGDQGAIAQQRAAYEAQVKAANDKIAADRAALAQNKAPIDALKGLTTYGTDLNQYLTNQNADLSNILSQDQAADYAGLNQLLNQDSGIDLSKAGQFNQANPYTFDRAGYDQFAGQQEQFYNNLFLGEGGQQFQLGLPTGVTPQQIRDPRVVSAYKQWNPNYNADFVNSSALYNAQQQAPNNAQFQSLMNLLNQNLGRNTKLE